MTSYYKYLPTQRRSKFSLRKRQTRQYVFALLLLLTIIFMSLYEFYFTIIERAKNGEEEANVLEAILCQVFMLTVCPKKNNTAVLQLRTKIEEINKSQVVLNFDGHGITDDTVVIFIQVHRRTDYLKELIYSFSSVPDIKSAFLIFSHDYFSEEINALVQSIDFAPVLQIFFPFSIQLYPNEFPGTSPNDCVWNVGVKEAAEMGCEGASTPDQYGHFRQGDVTQAKHHWWWKVNTVFEVLNVTKNFDGYILFLEEDHYLAPDSLHMLRLMTELAADKCPECNSFHLGNHKNSQPYEHSAEKVDVAPWNNLGYSFNRTLWQALRACSSVFCTFDDYNWDWSYHYTSQECFFQKLTTLVVQSSRVFHIGDCGMHHKEKDCDSNPSLKKAKELLDEVKPFLFPKSLKLDSTNYNQPRVKRGWGGWSDPRDIQLCLNISDSLKIS